VQSVGKLHREGQITSVDVIPKSSEKFISININREESDKKFTKIVFADSLNFTLSSLDKLVEQLVETKDDAKFGIVRQAFKNEINNGADYKLLLKKGIFPYSYIKSVENLKETTLPPINAFWSDLTEDSISPENYQHAQNVWNSFKCKSIADYQDLYVRLDVALLACVIEDRREQLYEQYRLDLNHYLTLPSIALDACLKFTNQEIGLISDPTMYLWVEDSIRGGYCGSGSCRSMKANNPYLPDYDASKPSNYIGYYDANNLYGWAMIQKLPTGNMEWLSQEFLDRMRQNPETFLENLDPNGPVGYMFEVDLHVPPSLHEKFNNFPPAPTKRHIQLVELSESYQVPLMQKLNAGLGAEKLITDLHDKSNYKIHYRLLQLYIDLGVQIKKVHTGLQFDQDNWIKPYIENNTRMRNSFESEFLRDLWKLLSNAIYGKQMENKRNRQSVQLVFDQKKARKLFRKPTIQQIIPIDQDLSLYLMKRVNVKLDTPIIVGSAILDLSKLLMYDIYYNFFYKKYGSDCTLIYTDTDSFIVNVDCQDLYRDIYNDSQFFDLSAYKTDHPLFGKFQKLENKQVLGKLKDEYANKTIQYAVCPRPKMYWLCAHSFQLDRSDGSYKWADCETKKAKGVSKAVTKKSITKQDFLHSVGADFREPNVTPQTIVNMNTIRSHRHQIFTEKLTKKAISAFDTKRFLMDFRNSLAFGHKDIPLYK
jgi:hypothetical protein